VRVAVAAEGLNGRIGGGVAGLGGQVLGDRSLDVENALAGVDPRGRLLDRGTGIAALDATVVSIALPVIGRDFGTGVAGLQWVMNGYTLTLAAFLLIGGSLGDRFGRRRVFVIGSVWFAAASMICAVAPDAQALIAARALQGVGAALLMPGSLAILQASFAASDRPKAIGAWSGLGGVATAIGTSIDMNSAMQSAIGSGKHPARFRRCQVP